ncbi:unnamed protein product [Orchesella dallaii]|uniref:Uncharacterized protein n=1 Tax=Orchesella dallaii TaxID=48710 RepID=A0ABP1R216_9HEXA
MEDGHHEEAEKKHHKKQHAIGDEQGGKPRGETNKLDATPEEPKMGMAAAALTQTNVVEETKGQKDVKTENRKRKEHHQTHKHEKEKFLPEVEKIEEEGEQKLERSTSDPQVPLQVPEFEDDGDDARSLGDINDELQDVEPDMEEEIEEIRPLDIEEATGDYEGFPLNLHVDFPSLSMMVKRKSIDAFKVMEPLPGQSNQEPPTIHHKPRVVLPPHIDEVHHREIERGRFNLRRVTPFYPDEHPEEVIGPYIYHRQGQEDSEPNKLSPMTKLKTKCEMFKECVHNFFEHRRKESDGKVEGERQHAEPTSFQAGRKEETPGPSGKKDEKKSPDGKPKEDKQDAD